METGLRSNLPFAESTWALIFFWTMSALFFSSREGNAERDHEEMQHWNVTHALETRWLSPAYFALTLSRSSWRTITTWLRRRKRWATFFWSKTEHLGHKTHPYNVWFCCAGGTDFLWWLEPAWGTAHAFGSFLMVVFSFFLELFTRFGVYLFNRSSITIVQIYFSNTCTNVVYLSLAAKRSTGWAHLCHML